MAGPSWLCPCWSATVKPFDESLDGSSRAKGKDDLKQAKQAYDDSQTTAPNRATTPDKSEPKKTTTKPPPQKSFGSTITAGLAALWNALEKGDENRFLDQSAVIERALPTLRAGSKGGLDVTSATSLAMAAGVPTDPSTWGKDMPGPDARYSGPHIRWPLTLDNVREVLAHVRTRPEVSMHPRYVAEILSRSVPLFKDEVQGGVFDLRIPTGSGPASDAKLVVCGDTHGQLEDFLYVVEENGEPSETTTYLMNGDIVDRGLFGSEILIMLLLFKQLNPGSVMMNRGNHENVQINRRRSEDGGGFYDEVMSKYSDNATDQSIFFMFQQLFELLPLATVVANRLFVIHGGLFRHESVRLADIRNVNRRRQCPTATSSREDSIMFDSMWSDPQDNNGVSTSHRGANCIRFGPDVTERFVRNNGLAMVVRSHELPPSNRGYECGHNGKLATLFTASDYCCCTGNTGAVMIIRPDLTYVVREHVAWMKDEEELRASPRSGPGELPICFAGEDIAGGGGSGDLSGGDRSVTPASPAAARPSSAASVRSTRSGGGAAMAKSERRGSDAQRDVFSKVRAGLAGHRDDLFKYWSNLDEDGLGEITVDQWREGVCVVLDLPSSLPWDQLQPMILGPLEGNGQVVHYIDYLQQSLPAGAMGSLGRSTVLGDECRRLVVSKFLETIISRDLTMRETMATFDQDDDGYVSGAELRKYLVEVHNELPDAQKDAILRAMHYEAGFLRRTPSGGPPEPAPPPPAPNFMPTLSSAARANSVRRFSVGSTAGGGLGRYSLDEFLGRFRLIYREGAGGLSEELREALEEIGKRLIKQESLTAVFGRLDLDGNGYVEQAEFDKALRGTPGLEHLAGRQDLWEAVDINKDGRLNLVEFCASFEVGSSESTEQMAREIWDSILLSLRRNSVSLDFVWRFFDTRNVGRIAAGDFKAGFRALNLSVGGGGLLTDQQLDVVVQFLDRNGDGMIDRDEWYAVYQ